MAASRCGACSMGRACRQAAVRRSVHVSCRWRTCRRWQPCTRSVLKHHHIQGSYSLVPCLSAGLRNHKVRAELCQPRAFLSQSPGRALELRASLSTDPAASDSLIEGLLELLVPGHFHVALSDSEKTHMRSAATQILNEGYKLPGPVKTSDQVGGLHNRAWYPAACQGHEPLHRWPITELRSS